MDRGTTKAACNGPVVENTKIPQCRESVDHTWEKSISPVIVPACNRDDGSFQAEISLLPVSSGATLFTTTDTCSDIYIFSEARNRVAPKWQAGKEAGRHGTPGRRDFPIYYVVKIKILPYQGPVATFSTKGPLLSPKVLALLFQGRQRVGRASEKTVDERARLQ